MLVVRFNQIEGYNVASLFDLAKWSDQAPPSPDEFSSPASAPDKRGQRTVPPFAAATTTLPFIRGCRRQKYSNVPPLSKVKLNLSLVSSGDE
jgi:hypothetical protein